MDKLYNLITGCLCVHVSVSRSRGGGGGGGGGGGIPFDLAHHNERVHCGRSVISQGQRWRN